MSRLEQWDAPALDAMRELAGQYPRYGYWRIQVFLARKGFPMSADRRIPLDQHFSDIPDDHNQADSTNQLILFH